MVLISLRHYGNQCLMANFLVFTSNPSSFTDELARYLMIWLGILGAAYVAGKNEHVAIDFFAKVFCVQPKIDGRFCFYFNFKFCLFALLIGGADWYITAKLEQFSPSHKFHWLLYMLSFRSVEY